MPYGSRPLLLVVAAALTAPAAQAACPWTLPIGGDPRVDPADFEITRFASGLDFPFGMALLDDGSLLVGVSTPDFAGASMFESTGALLRLVDADGDGCADGAGTVLYTGFAGPITSLRRAADVIVVSAAQRLLVLRAGAMPGSPLSFEGSLDLSYASGWSHNTSTLALRPAPGQPGVYEILFNVGSRENAVETLATVEASGLFAGSLEADSIYRATLDDTGPAPVVTSLTKLAAGLRNAFGIAFAPATGDLYFEDNGIDGLVNPGEPLSADELNRISAGSIGGEVEDFGFPDHYVAYRTGTIVGSGGILPLVAFQPIPPPNGAESEGPAEIAFAPGGFPAGLNDGLFLGFHGKFGSAGSSNEENALVYVDLAGGTRFHFIPPQQPAIGHLDSLLATADALFVAELTNASGLATADSGAIYRIRALETTVPTLRGAGPALLAVALLAGAAALGWRRDVG
jgi:glucose/arabinose dehydrogenase